MQGNEHYVRQILSAFRANPSGVPLVHRDVPTTAGDLADSVTSAAAVMRTHGVGVGSVVGILTDPNTPATLVSRYAANLLGATVVHLAGVNAVDPADRLSTDRQGSIVAEAAPSMITVDDANLGRARAVCGTTAIRPVLAGFGDLGSDVVDLTALPSDAFQLEAARSGDIAVVTYSSGSTGRPKGASWSFRVKNEMVTASAVRAQKATSLITAPLTHSSGFAADDVMVPGGTVVLLPGFDAAEVLRTVALHRVNRLVLSAPQLYALADHPDTARTDLSSVRDFFYTGLPASPERLAVAAKVFGPVLMQVYGTIETNMISWLLPHEHGDDTLRATVGRPLEWLQVTIRDPQDGRTLPTGESGEVCVNSPWSMDHYWNDPEQTARTVRDGWIRTGDIGHLDDAGYLHLHGRIADVIKANGIKVFPAAVERALLAHPAVAEAAVFGAENADRLERICATVVLREGAEVAPDELRKHVDGLLSANHAPADIELRKSLPLIGVGKPDKLRLRADASARFAAAHGEEES
ncbi:ANL family adenylate-forming protein [Kitasatospora sp. DSM 101779]|uniref:Aminocoumarin ligase n=1 Tax=Kitasatospora sp. 152608 TaxID=1769566 RepID=A0A0U3BLV8_9ACTN|nr:fatty acid--CoA ligase family protein [Kitasatospora sp. DSM 101779]ALT05962.1 aminocoumarin ligase [Kitasatospora sp. 152608]